MNNSFNSYLDEFDQITIIIPNDIYNPSVKYYLTGNGETIELEIKEKVSLGSEQKLIAVFDGYISIDKPYKLVTDNNLESELYIGKVVRTQLFDSIYYYRKNNLGFEYTKESTKFKVWSPTARNIKLELVNLDNEIKMIDLNYTHQGLWKVEIKGDLERYKYRYHVYANGKTKIITDPYALSSNTNSEYNYVIDLDKTYKFKYQSNRIPALNSIITELSIQDFSSKANIKEKAEYSAFYSNEFNSNGYGLGYLKELGITHIQIMPFFAFGGVNEENHFEKYNWGYNPLEYNVPSGLYSSNPEDPYTRINELKMMIDEIHKNGMNVVMDVVYNHVYDAETFPIAVLCSGYMFRYDRNEMRTEFSGCKNDIDTSKKMIRKFILDSILYWHNEYNIDGFRMDLMGLIDFETVNDIQQELYDIDPNILLYGEGWKMMDGNKSDSLAHMENKSVISKVGFFNDRFRNTIKDYAKGVYFDRTSLEKVIQGSILNKFLFKYSYESINYTECHDNQTLFDYIRLNNNISDKEAKLRSKLATTMTLLSLGVPFIHLGQEFYSTKNYVNDAYIAGDDVNGIDWSLKDENNSDIEFIKKVIEIRKKYSAFKLSTREQVDNYSSVTINENNTVTYKLNYEADIMIVFKNSNNAETIELNGYKPLLIEPFNTISNNQLLLNNISTTILIKEE